MLKIFEPVAKVAGKVAVKARPVTRVLVKYSPEITLGTGLAMTVTGGVLACRATLKARDMYDAEMASQAEYEATFTGEDAEEAYPEDTLADIREQMTKDFRDANVKLGLNIAKAYLPAAGLVVTGVALIITSHNIQARRIVAAVGAYEAVSTAFQTYRQNVINDPKGGLAADIRYMTGDKVEKAEFYETDENGKEKKVKRSVTVRDSSCLSSPYAILIDATTIGNNWQPDRASNEYLCDCVASIFTEQLHQRDDETVTLNDVYDQLGHARRPIGQFAGWSRKKGQNAVHIIIEETYDPEELERAREERRNPEPSFWVDFDCCDILDCIGDGA